MTYSTDQNNRESCRVQDRRQGLRWSSGVGIQEICHQEGIYRGIGVQNSEKFVFL